MKSLIIFASGRGSNAQAILDYFKDNKEVVVSLIVSNKSNAGVLELAKSAGIPHVVIPKAEWNTEASLQLFAAHQPSLIILAGFLLKVPESLVAAFPGRIINIHPALLPKHGGKGMWGHHVHEAVLAAGDCETGITIHRIDEVYDRGEILLQARCPVLAGDTSDSLAARVLKLEHFYFPRVIDFLLKSY